MRRFTITQKLEDPTWKALNHDECGYRFELSPTEKRTLPTKMVAASNSFTNKYMETCATRRDNIDLKSAGMRIVGGVQA